jgi:hypothetical protein
MHTPVEQAGEAAGALATQVRAAMSRLGDDAVLAMLAQIAEQSRTERAVYVRDDVVEVVRVFALPIVALPDQLSYARTVTLTLHRALKRLPDLYFADPDVRRVLQLPAVEEHWLRQYWTASTRNTNTVFGRHDAVCDFTSPDWLRTLWFVEPNLAGIGGLHLVPSAERVLARTMLPALHALDPALQLETAQDIRGLLMQELVDHIEGIGRTGQTICFVEPKYADSGPDEQAELARYVRDRFGVTVCHASSSSPATRSGTRAS